ncbi:hypothetical protein QWZ13_10310 [Reinekea marina]|nr:hypothetical protein [Reinekea marina]MDN3649306.1 hypothetical protein [Reinekea marina]
MSTRYHHLQSDLMHEQLDYLYLLHLMTSLQLYYALGFVIHSIH